MAAWGNSWSTSWGSSWGTTEVDPPVETEIMPDVVGETEADAIAAITGAGLLSPAVEYISSDTVDEGDVVLQSPPSGTPHPVDAPTTIYVSIGASDDQWWRYRRIVKSAPNRR